MRKFFSRGGAAGLRVLRKLLIRSGNTNDALLQVISTSGGGTGGALDLNHQSATPANGDFPGIISFKAFSSTLVERVYAQIYAQIIDITNASEDASLTFAAQVNGSPGGAQLRFGPGLSSFNATGGDQGNDTTNFVNYFKNGVALPFQTRFQGGFTTLATAALITQAHGLGVVPKLDSLRFIFKNASGGALNNWASGNEMVVSPSGVAGGVIMYADATNVYARISSTGLSILDKTTGAPVLLGATLATAPWNIALCCAV